MLLTDRTSSITERQRVALFRIARKHGWTTEQLREAIGTDSIRSLSRRAASDAIARLGGQPLAAPPGSRSAPRRRTRAGSIRMLDDSHRNAIEAIRQELGWTHEQLAVWLRRTFDVDGVDGLLTARAAARAMYAMNQIAARRITSGRSPAEDSAGTSGSLSGDVVSAGTSGSSLGVPF